MSYTWLQYKNAVKSLMTDATIDDRSSTLALAEYVKSYLTLHVDKNPQASIGHMQNWVMQRDRLLGYTPAMARDKLRAEVNKLITVDATRQGIQPLIDDLIDIARNDLAGAGTFINGMIRQGVIELQSYIEFYRYNQERVFTIGDAVENGEACDLTLPVGCFIQDIYYVQDDAECKRMPVAQYDWQNRYDLKCGQPRLSGHEFFAAVDPTGRKITLFPTLLEGYHLSVFYDALKATFADGDTVPFDEASALAIADYVRARMYLLPPATNPKMAAIHTEGYREKRRQLFRDAKDRNRIRFDNDSLYTACGCAICTSSFDSGGDGGGGSSDGGCEPIITVENREALKALASAPCRKLVFLLNPEDGVSRAYAAVYGDETEANDYSIIEPEDGLARYFEYNLA